jgi:hypothetical protein
MNRELFPLIDMKNILSKYNPNEIKISRHYLNYLQNEERDISVKEIIKFLISKEFYFVERQINSWTRYKIVYELSRKYDLVIIIKEEQKVLKVVSVYKTNKKLKEKWKKSLRSLMTK